MNLSLAITTYNRTDLLYKSFERVIDDTRIDQIVIVDDKSDVKFFEPLLTKYRNHPRVRVVRNNINLGVYHNKYASVREAAGEWVIVFDSDNIIDSNYLDALFALGQLNSNVVYTPSFAKPEFDYRHMSGKTIDRTNVSRMIRTQRQFDCLINTMNCVVNRERYLRLHDHDFEPVAADSAYFNYRWLADGGELYVVPNMEYEHRVHDGSHYRQTIGASNKVHAQVMNLLKNMK